MTSELLIRIFGTLMFLVGIILFGFALRRNFESAKNLMYSLFTGIVGGIVVAMFLDIKEKRGTSIDYFLIAGASMFFIGLIVFILTPKYEHSEGKSYKKNLKKTKKLFLSKIFGDRTLAVIGIISLIVAIGGFYIGLKQLQLAVFQTEYPTLNITHQIDEKNGRLNIFVKNTASRKETGAINFYRLEISDSKPHMQLESLKPGENITFGLEINVNYTIPQSGIKWPLLANFQLPAYKLYFITEKTSISYKITCDNCYPQGVIKRIPEFSAIESFIIIGPNYSYIKGSIPTYSWKTFSLEDLK